MTLRRENLLILGGWLAIAWFFLQVVQLTWGTYSDFDQIYMAGFAWLKGLPPYEGHLLPRFAVDAQRTNAMLHTYYYPPLCGMLFAPLASLPFSAAVTIYKFSTFGLLFLGAWQFLRAACPSVPPRHRWLLLGATALAGSVRWNLIQLQPSALTVALLLLFAAAILENRWRVGFVLGILISIKITYLLPVFGLYLFRHNYRTLFALGTCIVLLNVVSMLRTGPVETLVKYRSAMSSFEDIGKMTRPDALDSLTPLLANDTSSPLTPRAPKDRKDGEWAGEMTHLPFVLSAWGFGLKSSKLIGLLLSACLISYFALLWLRLKQAQVPSPSFQGILFASLLATSLVIVYHQRYDAIALLPLSYVAASALYRDPRNLIGWVVAGTTLVFAYLLRAGLLYWWWIRVVIPHGWLVLVPISGYLAIVCCLASIALLSREAAGIGRNLYQIDPSIGTKLNTVNTV